jgi:hypothetical protein
MDMEHSKVSWAWVVWKSPGKEERCHHHIDRHQALNIDCVKAAKGPEALVAMVGGGHKSRLRALTCGGPMTLMS